jgi:hypothetical protein
LVEPVVNMPAQRTVLAVLVPPHIAAVLITSPAIVESGDACGIVPGHEPALLLGNVRLCVEQSIGNDAVDECFTQ